MDRNQSDDANEEDTNHRVQPASTQRRSNRSSSHRHTNHRSSHNHYTRLSNNAENSSSSSSLISMNSNQQRIISQNQDINHNYLHGTSVGSFQTTNGSSIFSQSSSLPESLQIGIFYKKYI